MDDLDHEMPGVAWDLLPMDKYRAHNWHCFEHINDRQPYASLHTSLGCPYKCTFCCINAPFGKPSYRLWSPETVIEDIDAKADVLRRLLPAQVLAHPDEARRRQRRERHEDQGDPPPAPAGEPGEQPGAQ